MNTTVISALLAILITIVRSESFSVSDTLDASDIVIDVDIGDTITTVNKRKSTRINCIDKDTKLYIIRSR